MLPRHCDSCTNSPFCLKEYLKGDDLALFQKSTLIIRLEGGTRFITQGEPSTDIFFLKEGIVKLSKRGPRKEKILRYITANNYVGLSSIIGLPESPVIATTVTVSSFCFIDTALFLSLAEKSPKFCTQMITYLSKIGLAQYQRCVNHYQYNLIGKIANILIELSEEVFRSNTFPYSCADLTDFAGNSRENISRVISQLRREEIISVEEDMIIILDSHRLHNISKYS